MPDWRPELRRRLSGLRVEAGREIEIIEELVAHLDDRYDDLRADGVSQDDAMRTTLAELSEQLRLEHALEPLRQAHTTPPPVMGAPFSPGRWSGPFADMPRDLHYAVRMLLGSPGFSTMAILTLGLGIGVTTAVFSLVNATLLARLPVAHVEELFYVGNGRTASSVFSYPGYVDLRDHNDVFSELIAWGGITVSLNAASQTDTASGVIVSGNYFQALGVTAALGRVLTPNDDVTPGAAPVVMISHGFWQRRFGGRPDIVGLPVVLNGQPFTVVGVTPPDFHGVQLGALRDIFVPAMMQAVVRPPRAGYSGEMNPDLLRTRGNQWLSVVGRLEPAVTSEQARASLNTLQLSLDPTDRPRPPDPNQRISVAPVAAGPPGQRDQLRAVATLLSAVVGGVLLIACANVANLLLSRAVARRREIAVRLAIGAGRWRLIRQLLTESALIALGGGMLGVALAYGIVQAFRAWPPPLGALPLSVDFALDARVLAFTLVVSLATGMVFGLLPALRAVRPELVPALKDESFVPDGPFRRFSLKNALVVAQIAISLALLIGSALFVRSLAETQRIDSGYAVERLLTFDLPVQLLRYKRAQSTDFYRRAIEAAEGLPGVASAAASRVAVLSGGSRVENLFIEGRGGSGGRFLSEGGGVTVGDETTYANVVTPRYFATMGMTLQQGRDFGGEDVDSGALTVIINNTFANRHFAGGPTLGRRLSFDGPTGPWHVIVGVVSDSKYASLSEAPTTVAYVPLSQRHETGMTLYVRTSVDPAALAGRLRQAVQTIEPNLPLGDVRPMTYVVGTSLYLARIAAVLIGGLGGLALVLASIGLYGVLAFAVSRRTREIGIRSALGADQSSLFWLVVTDGMVLVGAGVVVGVTLALAGTSLIERFLVGVRPTDATTYAVVVTVLMLVAIVACALPARRATQVDPLVALRQQ